MPVTYEPVSGLGYGWDSGESGWKTDMDKNLRQIGASIQLSVIDRDLTGDPVAPSNGDRYIVGTGATGAWAGHDGEIALYDGGWIFYTPNIGWLCFVEDEDVLSVYKASGWSPGITV